MTPIAGTGKGFRGRGQTTSALTHHPPSVKHFCQICKNKIGRHSDGIDVGDGLKVHVKAQCRKRWFKLQRAIRAAEMRARGFKVPASEIDPHAVPPPVVPPQIETPPAFSQSDGEVLYGMVEDALKRLDSIERWIARFVNAVGLTGVEQQEREKEVKKAREAKPPVPTVEAPVPTKTKSKWAHLTREQQREQHVGRFAPRPNRALAGGIPLSEHIVSLMNGHLHEGITPAQMFEWLRAKDIQVKNAGVVAASMSVLLKQKRLRRFERGRYLQA